ncbi:MAG: sialate O-acetylesterase [Bryobacteraceae bacterium]
MKPFVLFLSFCALTFAQEIRVAGGLASEQVLQRDTTNKANAKLVGSTNELDGKPIEVRIMAGRRLVRNWSAVGTPQNGAWTAEVAGIPMGGPYKVELRCGPAPVVAFDNILVGDLWVLAGQSNMEGVGDLVDVQPPDLKIHSFDLTDTWLVAKEPLHTLVSAVDKVHWPRNTAGDQVRTEGEALTTYNEKRKKGAGLALPFAAEMLRKTAVPIGLVPCAHGGTSMAQWDPALRDRGGDSLYGGMIRRVAAVGGKVAGVLWYQGESDANPKAAPVFAAKFAELIAAIRSDFGQPDLPFYYVQLARHINTQNIVEWNQIQEAQRLAELSIPHTGMVAAIDSSLDDGIHVSTQDHKRLGKQFANMVQGNLKRGPRPVSAKVVPGIYPNTSFVRVAYSDVNGRLESDGRVSGFSIHSPQGEPLTVIFKTIVDPADPSAILLAFAGKLPEGAVLHYGFGKDPYCNLRDSAGMSAPVFGPMVIE